MHRHSGSFHFPNKRGGMEVVSPFFVPSSFCSKYEYDVWSYNHMATVWRKKTKQDQGDGRKDGLTLLLSSSAPTTNYLQTFVTWQYCIPIIGVFSHLRPSTLQIYIPRNKAFLQWRGKFLYNIGLMPWLVTLSTLDHWQSTEKNRGHVDIVKVSRASLQTLHPSN